MQITFYNLYKIYLTVFFIFCHRCHRKRTHTHKHFLCFADLPSHWKRIVFVSVWLSGVRKKAKWKVAHRQHHSHCTIHIFGLFIWPKTHFHFIISRKNTNSEFWKQTNKKILWRTNDAKWSFIVYINSTERHNSPWKWFITHKLFWWRCMSLVCVEPRSHSVFFVRTQTKQTNEIEMSQTNVFMECRVARK